MWVESSAAVFISICLKIQKYCQFIVFQSLFSQTQYPTLQTWCMRQVVYLENFMGKSTIVQKWWKKLSEFVKLYFKLDSHICTIFYNRWLSRTLLYTLYSQAVPCIQRVCRVKYWAWEAYALFDSAMHMSSPDTCINLSTFCCKTWKVCFEYRFVFNPLRKNNDKHINIAPGSLHKLCHNYNAKKNSNNRIRCILWYFHCKINQKLFNNI